MPGPSSAWILATNQEDRLLSPALSSREEREKTRTRSLTSCRARSGAWILPMNGMRFGVHPPLRQPTNGRTGENNQTRNSKLETGLGLLTWQEAGRAISGTT